MLRSLRILIPVSIWLLVLCLGGCSDSIVPVQNIGARSEVQGEGTIDPITDTFVLKTFDNPPPGGGSLIKMQLIGSNLIVDAGSRVVSIDVAISNQHSEPFFAPTVIWLGDFTPDGVEVLNPDLIRNPMEPDPVSPLGEIKYGFDYSELFGDDGVLGPGETSESRTWSFGNHDGSSFSFAALAEIGMEPDLPCIAGYCWFDENRNGIVDPDERSLGFGYVKVGFPNGHDTGVMVGPDGYFSIPVEDTGLYSLHFDPLIDTFAPIGFSTPNPREVLLIPGDDGQPISFSDANFGMFTDVHFGRVIQFTDLTPDSLHIGSYQLIDARVESSGSLVIKVEFSGCGLEEAFSLFMSGGIMESMPPQANIVLRKDLESSCDAIWQKEIRFDLGPLISRFMEGYGPGILLLNLYDSSGDVQQLELAIFPPD